MAQGGGGSSSFSPKSSKYPTPAAISIFLNDPLFRPYFSDFLLSFGEETHPPSPKVDFPDPTWETETEF